MPSPSEMQQLSNDIVQATAQWLVQLERMQEQRKQDGQFQLSVLQVGIYDQLHIVYNRNQLELHSWISDFSNGEYDCETIGLAEIIDESSARAHLFPLLLPALRQQLAPHFATPLLDYRLRITMIVNNSALIEVDEIIDPVKQRILLGRLLDYIDTRIVHGQLPTDSSDSFFLARHLMDAKLYPERDADYVLHLYEQVLARNVSDPDALAQHRSHFIRAFRDWVEQSVLPLVFEVESSWGSVTYKRRANHDISLLSPDMLKLTRQTAVLIIRHDPSYNKQIGLNLLKHLEELGDKQAALMLSEGSGKWPLAVTRYEDRNVSAAVNDLLGVVTIHIHVEGADSYGAALQFLNGLLEAQILRSYTIILKSKAKHLLPISGLAKSQTHRFFANVLQYEQLHPLLTRYARLAMKQYEWYTDVEGSKNVLPGTYAVFGLGLTSYTHFPLVRDYLRIVDQEHQSLQANYVITLIAQYGINDTSVSTIVSCLLSCQDGKFSKQRVLFESPTAIIALAAHASHLSRSEIGRLVALIWGSKKTLTKRASAEQGKVATAYSSLLQMLESPSV